MSASGEYIEQISEKFAILKHLLIQNGKLNLLNHHKHCENFVRNLLNIIYGLRLENLNKKGPPFKGLDLGSRSEGIAFEVTADNSSDKINAKLALIIKEKHYESFKRIHFFFLNGKQKSYTITTITEPYFSFDWKTNVCDFDDLMTDIKNLDLKPLKRIYEFISAELPKLSIDEKAKHKKSAGSFISRLFGKQNPYSADKKDEYSMSKNLWHAIQPPNSKVVHKSTTVAGLPAGLQFFSFEYGPEGHAFPLNLRGVQVRAEISFSCQIQNALKAVSAGNEYAMNFLPPKFLIEARAYLESYDIDTLRSRRLEIAQEIKSSLSELFDKVGFILHSVTIGALDNLTIEKMEPDIIVKPDPIVYFYNYKLTPGSTYHIVVGMPILKDRENERYVCTFPLSVGNGSRIDVENINVLFQYQAGSPLPMPDDVVRAEDKSYLMEFERHYHKDEKRQLVTFKIPFVNRESRVIIGELIYMYPTKSFFDIPVKDKRGKAFIRRVIVNSQFFFDVLFTFRNCPPQKFKVEMEFLETASFEELMERVTEKIKKSKKEEHDHVVYYPDFETIFKKGVYSLTIGQFNKDRFRVVKQNGYQIEVHTIQSDHDATEF